MSLQPSSGASKLDNKKESGGVAIALFSQSHFEKFTRIEADFSAVWCGLTRTPVECAPCKSKEKSLATKKGNATDDEIRLAIMNDLYDVSYHRQGTPKNEY